MRAALNLTVPVPIWVVAVFLVLFIAWQFAAAAQTRALKDLYDLYFRESRAGTSPETETP